MEIIDGDTSTDRIDLLKRYLSVDGVMNSEKRWWSGSNGFDFKAESESGEHLPSAEVHSLVVK